MTEQITKKQHFAPSFYFRRFADDGWLQTLDIKNGRTLKPRPFAGVCYAHFYYAQETGTADDASQEFELFFKSVEDYFSAEFENILDAITSYRQLSPDQLDRLAWFFACLWVRSPQMRKQLNRMMEDMVKWMAGTAASHPDFKDSSKEALTEEGIEAPDEVLDDVVKTFKSGDFTLEFDNVNHLQFITQCEEYKNWFKAKNWRFHIAKGTKQFITSDTPVVDIFKGETLQERMYGNHIMARKQFLPLTPSILIELTDPRFGKKVKRGVVTDDYVTQYNLMRVRHSEDYAYAQHKSDLDDLLAYYEG